MIKQFLSFSIYKQFFFITCAYIPTIFILSLLSNWFLIGFGIWGIAWLILIVIYLRSL